MAEIEDWEMKDLHILCLSMFCEFLGNSRIWAFCYKNWKASPDHLTIRFMILSFRRPHWLNQCIRSPVNANYFLIPSKEQTARPDCSPWSCEDLTRTQSVCVILMRTIGIKYDEICSGISLVLSLLVGMFVWTLNVFSKSLILNSSSVEIANFLANRS